MDGQIPRSQGSAGMVNLKPAVALCNICDQPVSLETAKADEYGRAIHEECYATKLQLKAATAPPAA